MPIQTMKPIILSLFAFVFVSLSLPVTSNALEIQEVTSEKGIKALLVEDYTLPIIAVSFAFEGGSTQDPQGLEGTVSLMRSLLDEGAGEYDSAAFQARLEELGVEIGFSRSSDRFRGGMRTLVSERDNAFEMLRLAINEPRFDPDAIKRMRDGFRKSLERSQTSPGAKSSEARLLALFPDHPYSRPADGDFESIERITRDDIVKMRDALFSREGLSVGVVGAISAEELALALDKVFAGLPETNTLNPVSDVEPVLGKEVAVNMPVPNASISLVYKGLKREDPDFFAAYVMNHILGGGTFTSRLYNEVREKRGLAYGVSSRLVTSKNAAYLVAGTSTRIENEAEALSLMKQVISDMAEKGVSAEELTAAKRYIIGSYAIANLDTSSKIARVLVSLQTQDLGIDYIDRRKDLINAVTLEDVNRLARELLTVEPTVVTVSPAAPADLN